jgi:hypothetical protein
MFRFPTLRTVLSLLVPLTVAAVGLPSAAPATAAVAATSPSTPVRQYLVVTDPGYVSWARTRMTELQLTHDGITLADLANANPTLLLQQYRAIFLPVALTQAQFAKLRSLVTTGGVLERFADAGGTLVLNVGAYTDSQIDIAPGGVDYVSGRHTAEMMVTAGHPLLTGAGYGGTILTRGHFGNWVPTDFGHLLGLPQQATLILANYEGASLAEYRWGRGRVILNTLSWGQRGYPMRTGPAWNNLLLYGAKTAIFGGLGGATATAEKVAPKITVSTRDARGQLILGPNRRPGYRILITDAAPSSGLVEISVTGEYWNVFGLNGQPVATAPLPYNQTLASGSNVTVWEILIERATLRLSRPFVVRAVDAAGNVASITR